MINITLNQVRLLKSLSLGERFPLSNLKGKIFQQLLDEHVLSKFPQGNGFIIYAHSPIALLNHLSNKYIKCSLDDYIEKMEINELRKVDNILMRGNSKSNETHPMNGFLVKSIEPIEVSLSKRKLVLSPEVWPVCFVSNHEEFTIPSDVTIVMVENPENFIFIEEQKEFFEGMRPLFTTYYPRDTHRSLVNWLETLPNAYIQRETLILPEFIFIRIFIKNISKVLKNSLFLNLLIS